MHANPREVASAGVIVPLVRVGGQRGMAYRPGCSRLQKLSIRGTTTPSKRSPRSIGI